MPRVDDVDRRVPLAVRVARKAFERGEAAVGVDGAPSSLGVAAERRAGLTGRLPGGEGRGCTLVEGLAGSPERGRSDAASSHAFNAMTSWMTRSTNLPFPKFSTLWK